MQPDQLIELIRRQRPGWSLERAFYISPDIYEFERGGWLAEQWYVLGHVSEVASPGSYIVRELLGESLIIVRDTGGFLRGFYNVCRHRGSRICDHDGRGTSLVCPYHAWSYHLDGSLRAANALPENIDTKGLALRAISIQEVGGIILGSLKGDPHQVSVLEKEALPMLHYHGVSHARIAARRSYPTQGNWKLVMENFLECYHCFPCHPEFCSVIRYVDVVGRTVSPEVAAAWEQTVENWLREVADPECPVKSVKPNLLRETSSFGVYRGPIGGTRQTESRDGLPVAPLMGQMQRFDGGVSSLRLEPFVYFSALNDHAVMFQFLPAGPERTQVIISWLVDGAAREADIDVERMIWLWDITTTQDKALIERNAAGVRSDAYTPGPYSTLESWPLRLIGRYLRELSPNRSTPREAVLPK